MNQTDMPPEAETDDDVEVLAPGTLIVVVDPLCGWCWGAAPALTRLAAAGERLEVVASGLFIGDRPMTPEFAEYAWKNDERIRDLTGQTFSNAYRDGVLGNFETRFDSGPATLALTTVQLSAPERTLEALHALQGARWVDGLDVTSEVVCAEVLRRAGFEESVVAAFLAEDEVVIEALNQRATRARELMSRLGARGVPMLARVTEVGVERIDSRRLFEDVENVAINVAAVRGSA